MFYICDGLVGDFIQVKLLVDRYTLFDYPTILSVIACFLFPFAVSEVFIKPSVLNQTPVVAFFGSPYPVIQRLVRDSRLVQFLPGGRYEFGAEFVFFQPGPGLLFQLFGKSDFLSLETMSFPGSINSHLCLIAFGMEPSFTCIPFELPADCTFMYSDSRSNVSLAVSFFDKDLDFISLFWAEMIEFLYDNTNLIIQPKEGSLGFLP